MLSASFASAVVYILSGILWRAGSGACFEFDGTRDGSTVR